MFETLSETCGFRMFMRGSSSTTGRLPALAAVFPEEVRQRAQSGEHGAVIDVRALAARLEEARPREAVDVMAQRRRRNVDPRLDLAGRRAAGTGLHDVTKNGETHGMAQRAE